MKYIWGWLEYFYPFSLQVFCVPEKANANGKRHVVHNLPAVKTGWKVKPIHLPLCCSFFLGLQKSMMVQERKTQILKTNHARRDLALRRSGVRFCWDRSVLRVGELFLRGLVPSPRSGREKAGDLVWPCPESAGSVLTTLVSIWILAALSTCPRIYAFSWLCVLWHQEFASQREDYFNENLFQNLFSTTGALPRALLILLDCRRSLFEESVLANNWNPVKTINKYLPSTKYTSHFQKGVIPHVVLVGKSSCAGLETLHIPHFYWTYIQPAVPLSFLFSSEDLIGCVSLDFI